MAEFVVVGKPNCGKNIFIKAFTGFEIFSHNYPLLSPSFPLPPFLSLLSSPSFPLPFLSFPLSSHSFIPSYPHISLVSSLSSHPLSTIPLFRVVVHLMIGRFEVTGVRFPIRLVLHHDPIYKNPVWSGFVSSSRKKLGGSIIWCHINDEVLILV